MGASTGQLLLEPDRIRAPSLGVGRASKRRAAKPADRVDGSLLLTPEAKMQVRLRRRVRTRRSQWWADRCSWNWSRDKGRVKGKNNGFPCFGQKYCPRPGLNEGPLYASKDHLQVQDDTTTPHGPIMLPNSHAETGASVQSDTTHHTGTTISLSTTLATSQVPDFPRFARRFGFHFGAKPLV